jgi:hypothetical protein
VTSSAELTWPQRLVTRRRMILWGLYRSLRRG